MNCPHCDRVAAPEHRFCLQCGNPLETAALPIPPPAPAPTSAASPAAAQSWKSRIPWGSIVWIAVVGSLTAYGLHKGRLDSEFELACRNGELQLNGTGENLRNALRYFDEALAIQPDNLRVLKGKGRAFRELKDYPQALAAYERAATLAPLDPDPPFLIGEIYREMKLPAKAVDAYLQAAKAHPDRENIQSGLVLVLYEDHAWTACVGAARTLLQRKPDDSFSRRLLGLSLAELGKADEARDQAVQLEAQGALEASRDVLARIRQREARPR